MSLQDKIVDVAEDMGKVYMAGVVRGASNDGNCLPTFDLEIEDKNGNWEKYKVFGYKVEE
jgi:hypothetical protein